MAHLNDPENVPVVGTITVDSLVVTDDQALGRYTKAIIGFIAAVLIAFHATITDDHVSAAELVNIIIAAVTAFGVWLVRELPETWRAHAKVAVAVLGAALAAANLALADGVTLSEWVTVALAAIGALGIGVLPNRQDDLDLAA